MNHLTDISNILVIGCGGAGLRAAIEAKSAGLCVKVLGKRPKQDAHTVLAAGGINAPFGNIDSDDSWEQHFADTYIEGYGIGNPKIIEIMAKESIDVVNEIDSWGANFNRTNNNKLDQRFFGAHTFRRTCFSGDYTGQSIINALLKKINYLNIPIFDSEYVTDLLVKDNSCFGAISFNIRNGERTIHFADSVIVCTGGHTRLWKKSSSRKFENTGDGYYLGVKVGCELIDMEMVQFHPTGMVYPEEYAGTLVTEAVRGEGGKLFNKEGERFMENYDKKRMELSTRDRIALANYTEIKNGRGTKNGGVFLDISHKSKEFIFQKLPKIYRQFLEYQMIDISKEPMEVAPTAHYSMGGIKVNPDNHSTNINGLFAAGEVAAGLHGANRLGGNSLAEILVFGRQAGLEASKYSKKLNSQIRCQYTIKNAHENISKRLKGGNNVALKLLEELRNLMWQNCGVLKEEKTLSEGLSKLYELKSLSNDIEVMVNENDFQDLILSFDLESSIFCAEATLKSAISRKESRGSHQRSDFKNTNEIENCNYSISLKDEILEIKKNPLSNLNNDLRKVVENTKNITSLRGKLLE